jgi:hypothetical protein
MLGLVPLKGAACDQSRPGSEFCSEYLVFPGVLPQDSSQLGRGQGISWITDLTKRAGPSRVMEQQSA